MAQTNFTPILLYSSSAAGNTPGAASLTNSTNGSELAINIADGKLFYKDSGGSVQVIAWKTTPTTAGGTGLTSYTAGDTTYYASGTTLSKLTIGAANTIMTSSGTAPQWSASIGPAQGGTGITSYAVGDLIYASGTTTLAKLADVTTGNALISGGVGVAPSWGKIGLTTHISGTLAVGNGGTGTATAFTAGSVVFAGASGVYTQDNSRFFWDSTNYRLGIRTAAAPYATLGVNSTGTTDSSIASVFQLATANTYFSTGDGGANDIYVKLVTGKYLQANTANLDLLTGGKDYARDYGWRVTAGCAASNSNDGYLAFSKLQANAGGTALVPTEYARLFTSGGFSIGNTTDPGAANLSVTGGILVNTTAFAYTDNKLRVQGGTLFNQKTAIVSTSTALVVSGVASMFVIRDNNVGGTALVLLDAVTGVTIVSQQGVVFTTTAPLATQIQLGVTSSPNYGMTATAGSTRNGDQINIGAVICQ